MGNWVKGIKVDDILKDIDRAIGSGRLSAKDSIFLDILRPRIADGMEMTVIQDARLEEILSGLPADMQIDEAILDKPLFLVEPPEPKPVKPRPRREPITEDDLDSISRRVQRCLGSPRINGWEREFLKSLASHMRAQKRPSEKQEATLTKLTMRLWPSRPRLRRKRRRSAPHHLSG